MEYKWIPVTERLPEEGVTVLVNTKFGLITTACIDVSGKWRIAQAHNILECYYISHWMPIPEPPKEGI